MKKYLKYKSYAHFDKKMTISRVIVLLKNIDYLMSKHGFYPFIHYTMKSYKYNNEKERKYKPRDIYYCAHLDRYIYQYYAHSIGLLYNDYMIKNDIDECSVAYRIERGKCNIDFAYDAFEKMKSKNQSIVIVGDFTSFFDNLNHKNLKNRLERVLENKIDNNLYKVFKSLTHFNYVDIESLYDYYTLKNSKRSEKFFMRKLNLLMDNEEFKRFIKMKNTNTGEKYIQHNDKDYGIVQGSPMSGLLANIYMIDFDKNMKNMAIKYNGTYLRYSDDFILILDNIDDIQVKEFYSQIQEEVNLAGQIQLKDEKTNIYRIVDNKVASINMSVLGQDNSKNTINFLGFSFDGSSISIRNKTISKYFYKLSKKIKRYYKKQQGTTKEIYIKFSKKGENKKNKKGNKGNFISYVKRSEKKFKNEQSIKNVRENSENKITEKLGQIKQKINKF